MIGDSSSMARQIFRPLASLAATCCPCGVIYVICTLLLRTAGLPADSLPILDRKQLLIQSHADVRIVQQTGRLHCSRAVADGKPMQSVAGMVLAKELKGNINLVRSPAAQ